MNVVLIGSGNVATQLGKALIRSGQSVSQVYSRDLSHAITLAVTLDAKAIDNLNRLDQEADFYFICVADQAIPTVINELPRDIKGIVLHTSGSTPMDIFEQLPELRYGVFYPVQTFSKIRDVSFEQIPLGIEASDPQIFKKLESFSNLMSKRVFACDSMQRQAIHIAAVFACNFSNHLYSVAERILQQKSLDIDLIRPLILETAEKALKHKPSEVQTGPAVRKDMDIIGKHLAYLESQRNLDPAFSKLYSMLSSMIIENDASSPK